MTLTTLGFGDIAPRGYYAQAFVSFEAVLGVLFTMVLLARLVALHTGRQAFDGPRGGGTSV